MALQIFMAKGDSIKVVNGKVKTTIRIPEAMFWDLKSARTAQRLPSDEAVIAAVIEEGLASWEHTGYFRSSSGGTGDAKTEVTPGPVAELTEDQKDILAMLADPRQDFLFTSVQKLVADGLEQYRKNFKPKTKATKTKAARPSSGHERQPTGT